MNKKKWYFHEAGNGYIYDKRIFWLAILVCVGVMIHIFSQYNFNFSQRFYAKCEGGYFDDGFCENPIFNSNFEDKCKEDWCKQEFLEPGEYGEKPPEGQPFNKFSNTCFIIILIALLLNHAIHNPLLKMPGIKLNLSDKTIEHLKKIYDKIEVVDDEPKNNSKERGRKEGDTGTYRRE